MDENTTTLQMITFQLGRERYAIDIMKVKEIHSVRPVRPIPNSPSYLEGFFSLRGDVIPLVNLHRQFHLQPLEMSEEDRLLSGFIIIKLEQMLIGVIIDKVLKVISYERSQIQPAPQILSGINGEYVQGVIDTPEGYLTLIDVDNLFSKEEIARFTSVAGEQAEL